MATTTLSVRARALRSTVALKALMAFTGLCLIGFLLMHMYGNLKMFMGAEAFNHYAEWLKGDILYPILPKGWFIWIFRTFLLACVVVHMYCAISLWNRANAARGSRYVSKKTLAQTYAARTMRWGGVILAGFLVFHLLQFTAMVVTPGFAAGAQPYTAVLGSFRIWWVVLAYAIWMVTVCMHIRHGLWSAFATLGANVSAAAREVLNGLAWLVSILLFVGFMIMPMAVLLGWVN